MCSWFDQNFCSTFLRELIVRYCTVHYRNFNEVFLCIFNTFCNCFLHLFRFTQAMAYYTIFIPHNNQG